LFCKAGRIVKKRLIGSCLMFIAGMSVAVFLSYLGRVVMKCDSVRYYVILTVAVFTMLSCGGPESEPVDLVEPALDTVVVNVTDTLGLLTGDSTLVFGTITQASWGEDGNLYVLDGQFGRLSIYSPELEFLRYVGRLGQGPGEFQYPQSFAFLRDGRLAVSDWGGGSVVFFDSSFNYIEHLTGYYPDSPRYIVRGPGDTYVAMNMEMSQSGADVEGNSYVARFGQGIEPEQIFISWPLMITVHGDPEDPDLSVGRVDQDFDSNLEGSVYLAERDDSTYLVHAFLADGTADTLVFKQWERIEKTQEQREQEICEDTRDEGEDGGQMGRQTYLNVYPWFNAIGSVDVDAAVNIWVGQAYTDMPTFEVYSPSGELLYVAVIPELEGIQGLEYSFRNDYLAYDRQPLDYPKVYFLETETVPAR